MKKRILIIDDNADFAAMLKLNLEDTGSFEVDTEVRAAKGMRRLFDNAYDVLILDMLMPDMTGYDVVKKIRTVDHPASRTPVIVISGRKSMEEHFEADEIACFLAKPFSVDDVMTELNRVLKTSDFQPDAESSAPEPKPSVRPKDIRKVVLAGVDKFIGGKIQDFLKGRGLQVSGAYDEQDAVRLARETGAQLLLTQYWEDESLFSARRLHEDLRKNGLADSTAFWVYCKNDISMDALKLFNQHALIPYNESRDLLEQLKEKLQEA